jgi:hypothetical protein
VPWWETPPKATLRRKAEPAARPGPGPPHRRHGPAGHVPRLPVDPGRPAGPGAPHHRLLGRGPGQRPRPPADQRHHRRTQRARRHRAGGQDHRRACCQPSGIPCCVRAPPGSVGATPQICRTAQPCARSA